MEITKFVVDPNFSVRGNNGSISFLSTSTKVRKIPLNPFQKITAASNLINFYQKLSRQALRRGRRVMPAFVTHKETRSQQSKVQLVEVQLLDYFQAHDNYQDEIKFPSHSMIVTSNNLPLINPPLNSNPSKHPQWSLHHQILFCSPPSSQPNTNEC